MYDVAKIDRFKSRCNILQKIEELDSIVEKNFNKKFRDRIFRDKSIDIIIPKPILEKLKIKRKNFLLL